MRFRTVINAFTGVAVVLTLALPVAALAKPAPAGSPDAGARFGAMYSFEHLEGGSAPGGFVVNFVTPFGELSGMSLGLGGELAVNKYKCCTDISGRGGVTLNFKDQAKMKLFIQALLGFLHYTGHNPGTDFSLLFGGGVIVPMEGKGFDVIVQAGVPIDIIHGAHAGFRFDAGIVFNLGK